MEIKNIKEIKGKSRYKKSFSLLLICSSLVFTACQRQPFVDSLESENFETIRQSTYFEGASKVLSREEFDGYKNDIIKAIKGESSIAKIDDKIVTKKIVVTPYKLKINDLSKETRVFLDNVEIKEKVENGMELILIPGKHNIKYELITPYYKEDKTKEIDTASFKTSTLEDLTGFKFRNVKINTSSTNAFLMINGTTFSKLNAGLNTVKEVPGSVPLEMYLQDEKDAKVISQKVVSQSGSDEFTLELNQKVVEEKPVKSSTPKTLVIPQNTKAGQTFITTQAIPGLSNEPYGYPTNVSILKLEPSRANELLKSVLESTKNLQTSVYNDISDGKYGEVTNYIQKSSGLDFYLRKKVAETHKENVTYKFKEIEKPSIIFTDDKNGYIQFTSKYVTVVGEGENKKETPQTESIKYYFIFNNNAITFTRNENIN